MDADDDAGTETAVYAETGGVSGLRPLALVMIHRDNDARDGAVLNVDDGCARSVAIADESKSDVAAVVHDGVADLYVVVAAAESELHAVGLIMRMPALLLRNSLSLLHLYVLVVFDVASFYDSFVALCWRWCS